MKIVLGISKIFDLIKYANFRKMTNFDPMGMSSA